jgi:16S rRNA (cytosine967-C5)-methyltransferase
VISCWAIASLRVKFSADDRRRLAAGPFPYNQVMPVSSARVAAFDILLRVERDSAYAAELLHSARYRNLSGPDHALATELVMGVLRWRLRLDEEISGASQSPLRKLDLEILLALRLALYQFRHLDRIPRRAALHESVELVKRARKRSAAAFVNAVLRKLSHRPSTAQADLADPTASTLASSWSHPLWMIERWIQAYGLPATEEICRYHQTTPLPTIRLRTSTAESELRRAGISFASGAFLRAARRVQSGDLTRTEAFRAGHFAIQDEGSQLVAALVGSTTGEKPKILDCCAAPGGKTLAIADQIPQGEMTAVELHAHRARLMHKLFAASGIGIFAVCADARQLPLIARFDRVLADVPCSGTGTLARNPEIKWRLTQQHLSQLRDRQLAILRSAMERVALKGRLVYATCSLEREENEDVVAEALGENHGFRLLDCREVLAELETQGAFLGHPTHPLTRGPYLRTIPGIHSSDGFFAAILERDQMQE